MKLTDEERNKYFNDNTKLAISIALKYNIGMDIEDTKQEALLALWVATGKYDTDRSENFGSYAYFIITSALQRHIVYNRYIVTVPRESKETMNPDYADLEKGEEEYFPVTHQDTLGVEMNMAIDRLPNKMAKVYRMKMKDMSLREIAKHTNMSHTKVSTILKDATALLQKWYGDK